MKKYIAYKFRLYPNKNQQELIIKTFGCCRFIWNKMLDDKIKYYEETNQILLNNPSQYKEEFSFLKEVDCRALVNVQNDLNSSYKRFYNKQNNFPHFKSKKKDKKCYTTNNINKYNDIVVIDKTHIKLPKLGLVKFKLSRNIPNNHYIKKATISCSNTNKFYISLLLEYEWNKPNINLDKNKSIGLDYSSPNFYIDSEGNSPDDYIRIFRKYENKLSREQKKLSHCKYESNNYYKQKLKVSKIYEKIQNSRLDFLHKLSTYLSNEYDIICVEDINMKNISQGLKLGKSTMDNSYGRFRDLLSYKLELKGKKLIKIDKWFPSSKKCSCCGNIYKELKLQDRIYICPSCNSILDRDKNAAINILNGGLKLI